MDVPSLTEPGTARECRQPLSLPLKPRLCLLSLKGRQGSGQRGMGGKWEVALSTTKHQRFPALSHMQGCKMTYSPENVGRTLSIDHEFQAHDTNAFWLMIRG